jgi:hypothetical protein
MTIQGIGAVNLVTTPIADSLAKVEADLRGATGRKILVLLTDGEETGDGDLEKVIRALQDKCIDVALNIVGFAIELAAGVYRLVVASSPSKSFDRVEFTSGQDVLRDPAGGPR